MNEKSDNKNARVRNQARSPIVLKFPADLTTPVRAFLTLTRPSEDAFLLESVAGGESQARYSFIGFDPTEIFEADDHAWLRKGNKIIALDEKPLEAFSSWVDGFTFREAKTPVPFLGGAVGWIDYSSYAYVEPVLKRAIKAARRPRLIFGFYTTGLVIDHLRQEGYLFRIPHDGDDADTCDRLLEDMLEKLAISTPILRGFGSWRPDRQPDRERFAANVRAIQSAIRAGDSYQVVISEPFEGQCTGDPFEVYRRLRRLNPSPYHFYVSLGGRQVVGASPEMLVRIEGKHATTIPIAGTRHRGASPEEDLQLENELLSDPKEMAEHAMLVDLARNDLGRVCEFDSVTVPVSHSIERFSHVMHIVSEVQGVISPGHSALEALWSTFPAGTVSGAPKIRAVQILSELEGADRGVYGGAVGIIDTSGNLETCIAIRTIEFDRGRAGFRSGAGIVADSKEESEWNEIHQKAAALIMALSGDGLDESSFCITHATQQQVSLGQGAS